MRGLQHSPGFLVAPQLLESDLDLVAALEWRHSRLNVDCGGRFNGTFPARAVGDLVEPAQGGVDLFEDCRAGQAAAARQQLSASRRTGSRTEITRTESVHSCG